MYNKEFYVKKVLYARAHLGTGREGLPLGKPSRPVLSAPRARVKGTGITSVTNYESVFSTFCSYQNCFLESPQQNFPKPLNPLLHPIFYDRHCDLTPQVCTWKRILCDLAFKT